MILIEGRVTKVEQDKTGWGETLRVVGTAVTVNFQVNDGLGDYEKDTVIHLPKEVRQPLVGDQLLVQVDRIETNSGLPNLAPIELDPTEPPDEQLADVYGNQAAGYPDDGDK